MGTVKHNVGSRLKLNVDRIVTVKGKQSYVVRYGNSLCRVPLFDWQVDKPQPKDIMCRLVSVNEFGFPVFEQVAQQEEVNVVEQVKPKETKTPNQSQKRSFLDKYGSIFKRKSGTADSVPSAKAQNVESKTVVKQSVNTQETKSSDNLITKDFNITAFRWSWQTEDFEKWYIESGGIRSRLSALISLAEQIADYHRKNKVYKDFAPEYTNVSYNGKDAKVIIPETNYIFSGFGNMFIYASHSAPEVVNRRMPNTPMSDCYSFAILAHEILALCHPFVGDAVNDGTFSIESAMKGVLPWIDDQNDKSNTLSKRKYDSFFTTKEVRELFKRTFEEGKDSPMARPTIFEWLDALYEEKSLLKYCPKCKTDYLYVEDGCCAFCDDEPYFPVAVAIQHLDKKWDKDLFVFSEKEFELYPEPIGVLLVNSSNELRVNSMHVLSDTINVKDILSVKVDSTIGAQDVSVVLEPLNDCSFFASTVNGELYSQKINKPTKIVFPSNNPRKLVLSLNNLNEAQRVINIQLNTNNIYAENQ